MFELFRTHFQRLTHLPVSVLDKCLPSNCLIIGSVLRQAKTSPLDIFHEANIQVKTHKHDSLQMRFFRQLQVLVPVPEMWLSSKQSLSWEEGWGQCRLNTTKLFILTENQPVFFFSIQFFLIMHSCGCKIFLSFQNSRKVDPNSFCQFICYLWSERFFGIPYSASFTDTQSQNILKCRSSWDYLLNLFFK